MPINTIKKNRKIFGPAVLILVCFLILSFLVIPTASAQIDPVTGGAPSASGYAAPLGASEAPTGAATVKSEAEKASESSVLNNLWEVFTRPSLLYSWVVEVISQGMLALSSLILFLAGKLLDAAMYFTTHMKFILDGVPIVEAGWVVFRDLANMVFIFILVYASISVILGVGNPKQLIINIIITAILINFSAFIAKAVVDASNLVALQFYNAIHIKTDLSQMEGKESYLPWAQDGPSAAFMDAMKMTTIYDYNRRDKTLTTVNSLSALQLTVPDILSNPWRHLGIAILGSITMLVAAFVFAAGAFLLFLRIIMLMFLIMISPLAFVARILPATQAGWNKWWHALMSNAIFAPAYFAMCYIIVSVVGKGFVGIPELNVENASLFYGFAGMVSNLGVVVNFIFMIIILLMALVMAKQLGSIGATTAIKVGKSAAAGASSFIGRNSAGRIGSWADKKLEKTGFGQSALGSSIRTMTTGKLADAKFFGKKSYASAEDDREKALKKTADKVGADPAKIYEMMNRKGIAGVTALTLGDKEKMYKSLSDRQRVLYEDHAGEQAKKTGNRTAINELAGLKDKLNRDQREKLEESYIREFRENPEKLASHLVDLSPELQEHMYDKLSARDRVAVESKIPAGTPLVKSKITGADITLTKALRESLSPEEKEKTEKAAREAGRSEESARTESLVKKIADEIKKAISGGAPHPILTGGSVTVDGVAYNKNKLEDTVSKISEKDIVDIDHDTLKLIAPSITNSQYKKIQKSDVLNQTEKDDIARARYVEMIDALGGGIMGVTATKPPNPTRVKNLMDNYDENDVAAFHEDLLKQDEVVKNLIPADLAAMSEKGGIKKDIRKAVATKIKTSGPAHPAYEYITTGPGNAIWKV